MARPMIISINELMASLLRTRRKPISCGDVVGRYCLQATRTVPATRHYAQYGFQPMRVQVLETGTPHRHSSLALVAGTRHWRCDGGDAGVADPGGSIRWSYGRLRVLQYRNRSRSSSNGVVR